MQSRSIVRRAGLALALLLLLNVVHLPRGGTVVTATAASTPSPPRTGDPDMPEWRTQPGGPVRPAATAVTVTAPKRSLWLDLLRWLARGGRSAD